MSFRQLVIFLLVLLVSYTAVCSVLAWVDPTVAPPGNNVEAPINAGGSGQTKLGTFSATQFIDANNPSYYLDPSGDSLLSGKLQITNTQIWDNEINRTNNSNLFIGFRNTANTLLQSNGGNVGIGTMAPSTPLSLGGSLGMKLAMYDSGTAASSYGFGIQSGRMFAQNSAGSEVMVWTGTGNVGIGNSAPSYKLDVTGDARITGGGAFGGYTPSATHKVTTPTLYAEQAQIGNPAGGLKGAGNINASGVCIEGVCQTSWSGIGGTSGWTDDGANVRLTTIGDNVGIGTAVPNQKLEVSGSIRLTNMDSKLEIGGANHVLSFGRTSYSGGLYYVTQLGDVSNRIFIGVDRYSGNTSGAFNGNEIISRGRVSWMVPNAANNGYVGIWGAGASDQIFIGNWAPPYGVKDSGAVTILSSGNVGIGTANPYGKLNINGGHLNLGGTSDPAYDQGNNWLTWGYRADNAPYYAIRTQHKTYGSYTYSRLQLNWHTGIEIGAHSAYGGVRFFDNSPGVGANQIFSVGDSDSNVRVANNLYVGDGGAFGGYTPSATHKVTTPTLYAEQAQIGNPAGGLKGAGNINASGVCIEGVCQTSWSGIGGTSGWTDDGANVRLTTIGDNVGIGTAAPDRKLDILDTSNPQLRLTYTDGTVYVDQQALSTGDWYVNSNLGKLLKTDSANFNTFLGQGAFNNLEGQYNTGLGYQAGFNNNYTTGSEGRRNTYIGYQAGYGAGWGNKNTGSANSAMGSTALYNNTTGHNNSAMGLSALYNNTTGNYNSAMGVSALYSNTTGYNNSVMGYYALIYNITGANNIAMGNDAGKLLADGFSPNQTSNNSVFLGYDTRASVAGGTNEIVIGSSAIGAGNNSAVLGNNSITKTLLKGNVGIGNTAPSYKLDITGDARITGGGAFGGYTPSATHKATTPTLYAEQAQIGNPAGGLKGAGNINASGVCIEGVCQTSWSGIGGTSGWTDDGANVRLTTIGDNVGIGTANPFYKLQVEGDLGVGGNNHLNARYTNNETYRADLGWNSLQLGNNGGNYVIAGRTNTGGSLSFIVNNTNDYRTGFNVPNGLTAMTIAADGNISTTNNLTVGGQFSASGADLAEEFKAKEQWPAGTVLVMGDEGYKSARPCEQEYDQKVVGVVSDNAAVLMGKIEGPDKVVVALAGVVKVKVTAANGKIKKGDLLTTSSLKGLAMKATEPKIGTIIGKALEDLSGGAGEVMALINLQ